MIYSCFSCSQIYTEGYPKGGVCINCNACDVGVGMPPAGAVTDAVNLGAHAGGAPVKIPKISTGLDFLDELLSGGSKSGSVHLIGGVAGVGKTTMCLQLCNGARAPLFISAEQPIEDVQEYGQRLGVDLNRILFHNAMGIGQIEALLIRHKPSDFVVDSLNMIYDEKTRRPAGSAWTLETVMKRLFPLAHSTKTTIWAISQVNAKGNVVGPEKVKHWCDVMIGLKFEGPSPGKPDPFFPDDHPEHACRELWFPPPPKNRCGPIASPIRLKMGERGLERAPPRRDKAEYEEERKAQKLGQGAYPAR